MDQKIIGLTVMGIGAWVIFDGVMSIIVYEKQSWIEQAVRVLRVIAGGVLIYLGSNII